MNKITLRFNYCTPTPPKGYNIQYRIAGSSDMYVDAGNFFISPAVFYDSINPAGTAYEGIIRSVVPNLVCNQIPWTNQVVLDSGVMPFVITGTVSLYCTGGSRSVLGNAGFTFNFSNPSDVNIPVQMAVCINGGGAFYKGCYGVVTLGGADPPGYIEISDVITSFTLPASGATFDTGVTMVNCYTTNNPDYPEGHPKYLYFKPVLPMGYSLVLTSPDPQYTIVII